MRTAIVLGVCAACGSAPAPAPPSRDRPPPSLVAPPGGPDDAVVAEVDGRPVWGSCVAAQARRGGLTRDAALRECIDLELLAQRAEAAGLARAPEVVDATRTALVGRVIAEIYDQRYRGPDDMRPQIDRVIARNVEQLDRPELRASMFARFELADLAPAELDQQARALAEAVHAELAGQTGLFPVHLIETATRIGRGSPIKLSFNEFRPATREALVPAYRDALYAVPEVGQISQPARTPWGWDVILYTQHYPPRRQTRDDAAAEAFPEVRRAYFGVWADQLARERGIVIVRHPRTNALLDPAAADGRLPAPAAPAAPAPGARAR